MWWLLLGSALAVVTQGETLGEHEVVVVQRQRDHIEVVLNSRTTGDQRFWITRSPETPDQHSVTLVAGGGAGALPAFEALQARVQDHEASGGGPLVEDTTPTEQVPRPTPGPATATPSSRATPAGRRFWRVPGWPAAHALPVGAGLAALGGALLGAAAGGRRHRAWWLVLIPMGILMGTMFWPLDAPFATDDQTQRVFAAAHPLWDLLRLEYNDQRHPPLLYLLLHGLQALGQDEALMRLPAVLAGLGAVAALFGLVWRWGGGLAAACIAAIWAVNTEFLAKSAEVGDHSLFVLLTLVATGAGAAALERPGARRAVLWGGAVLLAVAASFAGVQVWLAHGLVALAGGVWAWRRGLPWQRAVAPMAVLAVLPLVGWPITEKFAELVTDDTGARAVAAEFPSHMWGDLPAVTMLREWLATLGPSSAYFDLIAVAVGIAAVQHRRRPALLALAGATVLVGLGVSLAGASAVRMKAYYLLFVGPVLLTLAGLGLAGRGPGGRDGLGLRAVKGALLGLLVHGALAQHLAESASWKRQQPRHWAELQAELRAQDATRLVADPNSLHSLLLYYGHPAPLTAARSCTRPDGGWGTTCLAAPVEIWTLTLIPELAPGWEEQALDRLRQVPGPFHFVGTSFFENYAVDGAVREQCVPGRTWERAGLALWHCPAGVR